MCGARVASSSGTSHAIKILRRLIEKKEEGVPPIAPQFQPQSSRTENRQPRRAFLDLGTRSQTGRFPVTADSDLRRDPGPLVTSTLGCARMGAPMERIARSV